MELPDWLNNSLFALQIFAVIFFLWIIWPLVKSEKWKEKFVDNKQAFSILIVFIIIFIFVWCLVWLFDLLILPTETLT